MRIVARAPCSRAASASAWAWLPEETVHTPSGRSAATALKAPRNLKAPARWRFSALSARRPDPRVERARAQQRRAVRDAVEARGGRVHVVDRDRQRRGRGHCAAWWCSWSSLGDVPVAPDVAVGAADHDVDRIAVADVADLAHRRRVDARDAARLERLRGAVAELHLDAPRVQEVDLLLALVEVAAGLDAGRQHDRVHAERRHAQRRADLAKPGSVAEPVEGGDGPAVARDHVVHTCTLRSVAPRRSPEVFCAPSGRGLTPARSAGVGSRQQQLPPHAAQIQRRKGWNAYRRCEVVQRRQGLRFHHARRGQPRPFRASHRHQQRRLPLAARGRDGWSYEEEAGDKGPKAVNVTKV